MKQCTCYALRAVDCTCKPAKYGELYTSPTTKQEQGEPVAWQVHPFDYGIGHEGVYARTDRPEQVEAWKRKGWNVQPLYTHPQPKQDPVSDEERKYNIRLNSLIKQIKQETVALDVTLDEAAVEMLNAFSSPLPPSLDEYNELRLMLGEGHSGYGLYLSLADYPEEGSELLVNTHPQPKQEPLTDEQILRLLSRIDECEVRLPRVFREFARAIEAAHGIKP